MSASEAYSYVLRQEMNPSTVRSKLVAAFFDGSLPAKMTGYRIGDNHQGEVFFRKLDLFETIDPWFEIDFTKGEGRLPIRGAAGGIVQTATFSDVLVSRRHLLKLWPEPAPTLATQTKLDSRKGVGGAPTKYDWAEAGGYMGQYVAENDYPSTKAAAVKVLEAWFEDRNQRPDKRDLEKFVDKLWPAKRR